jgi:hypothetical protein
MARARRAPIAPTPPRKVHPLAHLPTVRVDAAVFERLPLESTKTHGGWWRKLEKGRWIVIEDHVSGEDAPLVLGVKFRPIISVRGV